MRRRARFLRKARELAYRDLGGLVFNLHRFGQRNDALVIAKLSTLTQIDAELRTFEAALEERQPVTVLREAGITACPRCAAIHSGEDHFCPNCGLSMSRQADLPIASAPTAAGAPASNGPPAPATATPAPARAPSAPPSAPPSATVAAAAAAGAVAGRSSHGFQSSPAAPPASAAPAKPAAPPASAAPAKPAAPPASAAPVKPAPPQPAADDPPTTSAAAVKAAAQRKTSPRAKTDGQPKAPARAKAKQAAPPPADEPATAEGAGTQIRSDDEEPTEIIRPPTPGK
jgi:hypothetical protein